MSGPVHRAALREEENRPWPAGQQVRAGAVRGPAPYRRAATTFAPIRCAAASASWWRSGPRRASTAAIMSRAVADLLLPGRGQAGGGGGPQLGQAGLGAQRVVA
jgi:hypothetical protein